MSIIPHSLSAIAIETGPLVQNLNSIFWHASLGVLMRLTVFLYMCLLVLWWISYSWSIILLIFLYFSWFMRVCYIIRILTQVCHCLLILFIHFCFSEFLKFLQNQILFFPFMFCCLHAYKNLLHTDYMNLYLHFILYFMF